MIGKTEVFILLISFLHLVSSFPSALGDNFKCKSRNGKFPKPGSFCRSYYVCDNWRLKEKTCPEDQHFFPAKGYCVWPEEYPCLEKPYSKECPLPDGKFLKSGTNCEAYYDCCKGRPTEKKCAKGTRFDHVRGKCDWPKYVKCPDKPKSKKCPRLYGKFLEPGTRCKKFYDCRDGISTNRKCPSGQLFDPDRETCEWREIYICVEDVSTTKSSSQSTSTLGITSTLVSESTKEETISTISPKIVTDSDEDSSSSEENSSEENRQSSTKSETISTSIISSTTGDEYTISTEGEVTISSTQSPSTVENSSRAVSSTATPDDISTISEISSASFTDEYVTKTATYPEVVTDEIHTEVVTQSPSTVENSSRAVSSTAAPDISTISEISSASFTDEYVTKTATYPEVVTDEIHTEVVTQSPSTVENSSRAVSSTASPDISTISEISSASFTDEYVTKTATYPEVVTDETHTEVVTEKTLTEVVTKETHPEVVTEEIHTETSYTIEGKDGYSTTVTSGLTDSVTTHIFCPKPNGYFPHPYDKHKFVACVGGDPTIMNCPENLVYDHKKRSCEYNTRKRKVNKMTKYL